MQEISSALRILWLSSLAADQVSQRALIDAKVRLTSPVKGSA